MYLEPDFWYIKFNVFTSSMNLTVRFGLCFPNPISFFKFLLAFDTYGSNAVALTSDASPQLDLLRSQE